jgi:hypothetical protein
MTFTALAILATASFAVEPIPETGRLAPFHEHFTRHVTVFGIEVIATPTTPDAKILHAANVLAQYLDNDEDGTPDDPKVVEALTKEGAFLMMFGTEREAERLFRRLDFERVERAGFHIGQDLYAEETLPKGPPHIKKEGRFDASLEEVLHLVSQGYAIVYPKAFGFERGSRLSDAMDLSRGGTFRRVPKKYPESAWYHYGDRTCDYSCMAVEYLYWALTTLHGAQDYPGRANEINHEWEPSTAQALRERDTAIVELLEDPRFKLPRTMPDGTYTPRTTQALSP